MPNTSATGGALLPSNTPLSDDALDDFLQAWVVSLTGLPGSMVRPRWQPEPSVIPEKVDNWCAIGIVRQRGDINAAELHFSAGNGYNEVRRHEDIFVSASFYGHLSGDYSSKFREGMSLQQNREVLGQNSFGIVSCGEIIKAPELIKQQWYRRSDLHFILRRQVVRDYPVQQLLGADITLNNEHQIIPIIV